MRKGFDNDKYLAMQSEHIRERIAKFDNKLYLEFGGKLYDDYHASRVLPGFEPDSKLRMLMQLADQVEIVIVISAEDIEKNKVRGDLGITYDSDLLRLKAIFESKNLYVGSVCITHYAGQYSAQMFQSRLEKMGVNLGKSIAGLMNIFNPELVILGGTLSLAGEYISLPIKSAIRKYSLNLVNQDTEIKISKLGERAGAFGACLLSRSKLLGMIHY